MSQHSPDVASRRASSCYFVTISRGDTLRSMVVRTWQLVVAGLLVSGLLTLGLCAAAYEYFRDDMVSALLSRQTHMQYAYEDRIAALRSEIDRVASQKLLKQDSVEGRVHDLVSRQAQLELHASMIASLAGLAGAPVAAVSPDKRPPQARSTPNPLLDAPVAVQLPPSISAYAPEPKAISPSRIAPHSDKPRPEAAIVEPMLNSREQHSDAGTNPDVPLGLRLRALSDSLQHIESIQVRAVATLADTAQRKANRIASVINETGLSPDRMKALPTRGESAMGGPLVPIRLDGRSEPFERELARLQTAALTADRLTHLLPYLPLRQPLAGELEMTSPYGSRIDPFTGRLALHTGIDLRDELGAPIRSTAAGTVTIAAMTGGYGNMVEIDHGNGLTTRYAHLSAMLVSEGEQVSPGQIVGRLGSTGRSTGPHLHYEVRINGEPVDPVRFLHAAKPMAELASAQ